MRKPDNRKPAPKGKGGSFKPKGKSDRKADSLRSDSYRPRRSSDGSGDRPSGAGRKPYSSERSKDARSGDKPDSYRARRTSGRSFDEKPDGYRARRSSGDGDDRPPRRREGGSDEKPKRTFGDRGERKSFRGAGREREAGAGERKSRPFSGDKPEGSRARKSPASRDERPKRKDADEGGDKPFSRFRKEAGAGAPRKRESSREDHDRPRKSHSDFTERKGAKKGREEEGTRRVKYDELEEGRAFSRRSEKSGKPLKRGPKKAAPARKQDDDGKIRLNKYLSNAGIASRREADTLIQSGVVRVNGVVVDQLGYKINPGDKVTYGGDAVKSERKVYLLLNKPKDYITTTDDPQERKTVMELIAKACKERVYPVGRLDRNTTGLLLFTNDGELATKLMHPKFRIKKVYHVSLNKGLKPDDFKAIMEGIELEDGLIQADDLAFVGEGKKEIGIEIHSGRNRIVRRIFEHLGYDVLKLDRVSFAGLTKKDLPRGKYRFLTGKEMGFLQMIG